MTPAVTIVVPTFNEEDWIEECLRTLDAQDYPNIEAIVVVDGRSTDGTRALVEAYAHEHPRVELHDNPRRSAAAALNAGLAACRSEVFLRADAHTFYAPDFASRSVAVLLETGADDVGGPMVPVGRSPFGKAVAAVTTSRFGIGSGVFHYATERKDVDTVFLGCYRTDTLRALGGWDEDNLQWAAEDHELNFRLTQQGGRIVCDPSIKSTYFPRDTPRALWRQYFNYGVGKVSTLKKHKQLPTLRPLAPAALVAGLAASTTAAAVTRKPIFLLPAVAYAGAASLAAASLARNDDASAARCLAALGICHVAYGAGFWSGVGRVARKQPFDRLPAKRR